jgi:hypothetical protein
VAEHWLAFPVGTTEAAQETLTEVIEDPALTVTDAPPDFVES